LLWLTFCTHMEMLPVERVAVDWEGFARPGHWLPSFWIGLVSINPLMRYIKPRITPPSPLALAAFLGAWVWQEILAGSGFTTWQTRQIHSPRHWLGWGWRQGWGLVWLIYPTAYSFVMISPNLLAIWVFLFLNLSQDLKLVLLRYFGTLGDG